MLREMGKRDQAAIVPLTKYGLLTTRFYTLYAAKLSE